MPCLGARRLGDADADGPPPEGGTRQLVDRAGHCEGVPAAAVGQQQRELVAARAVDRAFAARRLAQAFARLPQICVAGLMPLRVVDPLQPVEVDRHQGEGRAAGGTGLHCGGEVVVEGAVVAKAGEAVGRGLELGLLERSDGSDAGACLRCESSELSDLLGVERCAFGSRGMEDAE